MKKNKTVERMQKEDAENMNVGSPQGSTAPRSASVSASTSGSKGYWILLIFLILIYPLYTVFESYAGYLLVDISDEYKSNVFNRFNLYFIFEGLFFIVLSLSSGLLLLRNTKLGLAVVNLFFIFSIFTVINNFVFMFESRGMIAWYASKILIIDELFALLGVNSAARFLKNYGYIVIILNFLFFFGLLLYFNLEKGVTRITKFNLFSNYRNSVKEIARIRTTWELFDFKRYGLNILLVAALLLGALPGFWSSTIQSSHYDYSFGTLLFDFLGSMLWPLLFLLGLYLLKKYWQVIVYYLLFTALLPFLMFGILASFINFLFPESIVGAYHYGDVTSVLVGSVINGAVIVLFLFSVKYTGFRLWNAITFFIISSLFGLLGNILINPDHYWYYDSAMANIEIIATGLAFKLPLFVTKGVLFYYGVYGFFKIMELEVPTAKL